MNYKLLYQLETEENHKLKALVKHLLNENQTLAIRLKHAKQPKPKDSHETPISIRRIQISIRS